MRTTFIESLTALAERDPNLWLLCGDLGYSVLETFVERFPDRFINVGVAEQNMIGVAAGIALTGKTVFVYSIGNFPTFRCLEQIRNDVCYHGADVTVVAVGAGYAYGGQGYTHHALEDVAVMSALPAIEIFTPCDPVEVRAAAGALATSGRPGYLRLSRAGEPVLRHGAVDDIRAPAHLRGPSETRCTILVSGPIASACIAAAELLARDGMEVDVVSVPCLRPFDSDFVRTLAARSDVLVTVEEHVLRGGLYAAVCATLAAGSTSVRITGIGVDDTDGPLTVAGDRDSLLRRAGLAPEGIAARVRDAAG